MKFLQLPMLCVLKLNWEKNYQLKMNLLKKIWVEIDGEGINFNFLIIKMVDQDNF